MAGKLRGKLNGKTTRGETVRELPEWVSISEAERLTGLSARTIKRMAAEGQLKSSRTPGSHMRVSRADVDRLLRRDAPASVSASSVLQNKRERVEELGLEARELRAQREIDKLREEGAQAERARALDRRAHVLAQRRALEEIQLQREQTAHDREQEQRKRQREQWQRAWINGSIKVFPEWTSGEVQQILIDAIKSTLDNWDVDDSQEAIGEALECTIERVIAPRRAEREAVNKRDRLIERTISYLPLEATDAEKTFAAMALRSVLAGLPVTASELEIQTAIRAALGPFRQVVDQRLHEERGRAGAEAKERFRLLQENAEKQKRESAKKSLAWWAEMRVEGYLRELVNDGEVEPDALVDTKWLKELKAEVRERIERNFDGEEDRETAMEIASEVVDRELG